VAKQQIGGKGNRKKGRNLVKAAIYRSENRREENMIRRAERIRRGLRHNNG
jgi:hypothetical protein